MGMAEQEIEVGMGSLPIHFRRVRDQNRKLVVGYRGSHLLDVVHSVEMSIVDAAEVNAFTITLDKIAFVTGDTMGGRAAEFLSAVDCPVLEKPFTPAALRDLVDRMIKP